MAKVAGLALLYAWAGWGLYTTTLVSDRTLIVLVAASGIVDAWITRARIADLEKAKH